MRKAVGKYPVAVRRHVEAHKLCPVTLSAFVLVIIITMEIRPKPSPDAPSITRHTDATQAEGVEHIT
jgi:hypothetical protein